MFKKIYLVAEIGCNHMGDMKIAKWLVEQAKQCGADYVKFQKRDN
jgi:N-acetylneuraminate synthase